MPTPLDMFEAEARIKRWHAQTAPSIAVKHALPSTTRRSCRGWLAYLLFLGISSFKALLRMQPGFTLRRAHTSPTSPTVGDVLQPGAIPTMAVLQAVAYGELSPGAARSLLQDTVSTLALLQAVAWGEISPTAAGNLLGRQSSRS